MAVYKDDSNEYTSKGVGTAGLTLGVIGTALASGILGGGPIGGLFGAPRPDANPMASPVYQLAQKDAEITRLQAEKYADHLNRELSVEVCNLKQRVAAIEVAEPLREQILNERIACVQNTLNRLVQPMIPNANVAPGWGPAFVSPFPPVPPTTATNTPATSTTGNG